MLHPAVGQIVRVRSRQYLVEDVELPTRPSHSTLVRLSCLDDDAQSEPLEILWEREVDARLVGASSWQAIARRGFDAPRLFSAYLHTLRWNTVTSTDARLFQAPYRAGIEVKAYQLEPLRKALLMPRVNLFIADDVGLGKTIEAGLILRELLMRQKVRRVVVSCPPSVVRQWHDEMEQRFGLTFVIFDRDFMAQKRLERGYGVNAFTTHNRFIISHALLRDETYAAPLRDWLGVFSSQSLLILDEAHNAAPASGARYAIDSRLTRVVRELAPRFEHKLFLSATPHNGHSNSFAALLEILDPQRFCRGVPVSRHSKSLAAILVRRLKKDLRALDDDFPDRKVLKIVIDGLPETSPELVLSRLLHAYRQAREERLQAQTRARRTAARLVLTSLQKRLLSSIEAFARTLAVHRRAMERQAASQAASQAAGTVTPAADSAAYPLAYSLLGQAPDADDDRAELAEDEVQAEEDAQMFAATAATASSAAGPLDMTRELALLEEMSVIAARARHDVDARLSHLIGWIRENLCPDLGRPGAAWQPRRVLIFTEYADTKRYLHEQLHAAIAGSDRERERIATFHGGIGDDEREAIKTAFNADPARHPLRILIATDAAREGVNLQNHCADLFHFDVPWNPSRMEQRNGRIDRKLQRARQVRCHYYVLPQRAEDRVLEVLVKKTATIQQELGSLSPVIERKLSSLLADGIDHERAPGLVQAIEYVDTGDAAPRTGSQASVTASFLASAMPGVMPATTTVREELESVRQPPAELAAQLEELQAMLETSRQWIGLSDEHFRNAMSASLEMIGAKPLTPASADEASRDPSTARWILPALDERVGADPTWAATLDTLRPPRQKGQKPWEWRKQAPIRPVVFRDPGTLDGEVVHLHLEHRVVQRLLGRFVAQGFVHHELTRACVVLTDEALPRVIGLGRLSLHGDRAARLHDEIVAVAADWPEPPASIASPPSIGPETRRKLKPLARAATADALRALETSLAIPRLMQVPERITQRLAPAAERDVADLVPHLEKRAAALAERAAKKLLERGAAEAEEMRKILLDQRRSILERKRELEDEKPQLAFDFSDDEKRQLAADRRYWNQRLAALETEIVAEPERIRQTYQVKARRVEPIGLVYLWPVSR
jgi:SNF2 family DNA or RNA helicase